MSDRPERTKRRYYVSSNNPERRNRPTSTERRRQEGDVDEDPFVGRLKRRHDGNQNESYPKRQRIDDNSEQLIPLVHVHGKQQPHLNQSHPRISEKPLQKEERFLQKDATRTKYFVRPDYMKTVIHWGQRKLLMSEIEFLTDYGEKGDVVLYAGAAPGTHTNFLSNLFPDIKFVLVDPADFICPSIEGRIQIRQEYFTDAIAEEYSNEQYQGKVLFISDIRRDAKSDKMIQEDMDMQSRWHKMIKPKKTMLKFRLSWSKGTTKYLDGKIYLPVWGPQSTTESRLVPDGDNEIDYDHTQYEEQMFHFNTVTRVTYYPHDIDAVGLDNCFDCASEILIIKEYLKKMRKDELMITGSKEEQSDTAADQVDTALLKEMTEDMIESVTRECSIRGRNLLGPKKVEKHFAKFHHVSIEKLVKDPHNL